jgi:multiple sugar transport system substrate-binding protein
MWHTTFAALLLRAERRLTEDWLRIQSHSIQKEIAVAHPLHLLTEKFLKRQITRRQFVKAAGVLGVSLPMLNGLVGHVSAQEGMSSAATAERVAKEKYSGQTLNIVWESGLQAQDPLLFSGPLWTEKTGVNINVIEVGGGTELFSRQLTEHISGTGGFDVLSAFPSWMADYVFGGVVEPLDDFIAQYGNPADAEDITTLYKDLGKFEGKTYGLFDDGDTLVLYYRKDLFAEHGAEFAETLGYELAAPTNWKQFEEIAKFFTQKLSPDVYGAAFGRGPGVFWNTVMFMPHFKANGGRLFDPDTMAATINGAEGLRTIQEMAHVNRWMPPGIEQLTAIDTFQEWLAGKYAMTWFWPPLGRWSAGLAEGIEQLSFVPESKVKGNVGYALLPGDITQMAGGFNLCVSADSPNKELAYLFIQWLNSPEISLQRVTLPYALRDPFRLSHFASDEYRSLWPDAGDYLNTLLQGGEKASLDLLIPGAQEYSDAIDRACTAVYAGTDAQAALDTAVQEMNAITDRLGRDKQKQAYANYLTLPGAYPSANLVDAPSNLEVE